MFKAKILATQELVYQQNIFFWALEKLWSWLRSLKLLPANLFPLDYFLQAARIPNPIGNTQVDTNISIELLFVSTNKDFLILPHSVEYAFKNCRNYSKLHATIIVPDLDVATAYEIFESYSSVQVLPESQVLGVQIIDSIRARFGWRSGWVIQQLLKFEFSTTCESDGVLIIDSDTLLIRPRTWLNSMGEQVLTPTWERNSSYYRFLEKIGMCSEKVDYSFVPHHMLIQPKYLRRAREQFAVAELQKMVDEILNFSDGDEVSPFCIDFEFYAQYMYNYHSNLVRLEKWSNVGVKRIEAPIERQLDEAVLKSVGRFASISLHAYL